MSFYGITNLNQYAAMQTKQTKVQNKEAAMPKTADVTEKNESETATSGNSAVKMDLSTRKALAKGPLDEAEIQRRIDDRAGMRHADINDVRKQLESSRPHAEEVEQSKANAAKFGPIQNKVLSGKPLTAEEKSFLRDNFPEVYSAALRIEEEVKMLKEQLSGKSKEEAGKLIMQKKMQLLSGGKDDNLTSSLIAAFDEVSRSL